MRGLKFSGGRVVSLLGDIEPAGRLVITFPVADGAAPAWSVSPVNGKLRYDEGMFIGYRGAGAGAGTNRPAPESPGPRIARPPRG